MASKPFFPSHNLSSKASKPFFPSHNLSSKQKAFLVLGLLSLTLPLSILLVVNPQKAPIVTCIFQLEKTKPAWFNVIEKNIGSKSIIKVGLVNIDTRVNGNIHDQLHPQVKTVSIEFDHVDDKLKWEDFFPGWSDENEKWGHLNCPNLPMPKLENYRDLNMVVATVPCGNGTGVEGIRDVFRLQVNLVVANLVVESGWVKLGGYKEVYVVFIGSCDPMVEIFRCDDLLFHQLGEYRVYKPDLGRLWQKTVMPVGTCQVAHGHAETGKEAQSTPTLKYNYTNHVPRLAYVTVLHSSEAYVCGAITLAQSLLQTKKSKSYTIDLLLLADDSIGPNSIRSLKAAGWKIQRIQRILNPFARKGSYNEWNYSKLRIWQLTIYDKIIFMDSDIIVLKNIDNFFTYPQLSAAHDHDTLYNSGLMVIEPSMCMFKHLMKKSLEVKPYNGGDQGFINEVFTSWHRLPRKVNYFKIFQQGEIPKDLYAIHYFGLKPWMCYRDYDCNWDNKDLRKYASDSAHERWWQVYDTMPTELQSYCGLTKELDERLMQMRSRARNDSLSDEHWKIEVTDPRRKHYVGLN